MVDFPLPVRSHEKLLDSEQAAALIKVHPKTLQRYARQGIVKGVRVGKLWRFRASEMLAPHYENNLPCLDEQSVAR
jgi:excisionase family DNA binding protein